MADVTDVTGVADAVGLTDVPDVPDVHGVSGVSGVPVDGSTALAAEYFQSYSVIGLLALIGVLFVAVAFGAGRLLRPVVPTPEKLLTYECGVDPVGEGWAHTQVRYYVYAFLYVIFAVDSIFLFPWATVFAAPGYGATTLVEMFIFLGFLAVGLLYAWKKGVLAWA
ncbi:NADH-quinone oxidoreductase subunit A [Streptomyces sp. CS057]|uniref:NADH-quinone oxidoreductase subunit A n=1 Tax=Streptomyces sp. CS057 TaxID=1982764 RepID=UPI00211B076A|nr:NADH-quinone oxidoreductase subunit A [Streptomyces sp. CS057]